MSRSAIAMTLFGLVVTLGAAPRVSLTSRLSPNVETRPVRNV
jgi:hypothetical protein